MSDYDKILSLVNSDTVELGADLPKVTLHKWLTLSMTNFVVKYGCLSDGHEKITDSQRYAQAIREMYGMAQGIKQQRATAKRAQAKLLRAKEQLEIAKSTADRLDAEADLEDAENLLASALVTLREQMRVLNAFDEVRRELGPKVEAQYPEGIEQAELDNWTAVYKYRMEAEKVPGMARQLTSNVPLPPEVKAELGIKYGRMDSIAPLLIANPQLSIVETKDGRVAITNKHLPEPTVMEVPGQ